MGTTRQRQTAGPNPPPGSPITEAQWPLFHQAVRQMVEIYCLDTRQTGSGLIIISSGHLLTAYHVVRGAKRLCASRFRLDKRTHRLVRLKRRFVAVRVFSDRGADLAVLRITRPPRGLLDPTFLNTDSLEVGIPLYRVGRDVGRTYPMSAGYVVKLGQHHGLAELEVGMRTDGGGSGGPVFDRDGYIAGLALRGSADEKVPPITYVIPRNAIVCRLRERWHNPPPAIQDWLNQTP